MKCIVLIYANEFSKVAKDFWKDVSAQEVQEIVIAGDFLKMEDLRMLQEITATVTAPVVFDSVIPEQRDLYEAFLLGKACALGAELSTCKQVSKAALEMYKNHISKAVPVLSVEKKKKAAVRKKETNIQDSEKDQDSKDEKQEDPDEDPDFSSTSLFGNVEKPAKVPKKRVKRAIIQENPVMKGNLAKERGEALRSIIMKTQMSKADKEFFTTPGNLAMLEDVILRSTKETMGFSLHMTFGDKGEIIFPIVKENWEILRAQIGEEN